MYKEMIISPHIEILFRDEESIAIKIDKFIFKTISFSYGDEKRILSFKRCSDSILFVNKLTFNELTERLTSHESK
jgi:hypothetical protein